MVEVSRRQFVGMGLAAVVVGPALLRAAAEGAGAVPLAGGWEYFQGSLDTPFEVWNSSEIAVFQAVTVPHCFNAQDGCDPDVPAYRGPGWYRTHVVVANPYPQGRTLLHFAGAGQTTDVFVGDAHVAQHVGGYDEWMVDVTDALAAQAGKAPAKGEKAGVRVAVRCDNGRDLERMPSDQSDFTLYGGLYRPVTLVYVPGISVECVHVRVTPGEAGGAAEATVTARLYAPGMKTTDGATFAVEVLEPGGRLVERQRITWPATRAMEGTEFAGERTLGTFRLAGAKLWSPESPNLYQCRVTLTSAEGTQTVTERFGVRTTEWVEGGPFRLNGERLLLRGTHRHEDHAGYAAAMPAGLIREEMLLIKAMGANFIRLAHYQQNRQVLELCDELGLLVWEELTWCRAGVGGEKFKQMGRDKMRAMIDQHRNHACVLLWGLGNEDDWPTEFPSVDPEAIRGYMTELRELAHRLDPTRRTSYRRSDFARDIPDVYSPSIWAGWYGGRFTDYQKSLETQRARVKHMIHIEYGADSHAGRHAEDPYALLGGLGAGVETAEVGMAYLKTGGDARVSRDGDWSETYACDLFDWHLKTQEALPWLTGAAQWIFKDFTTPLRADNPVPRVNQKGLVTRDMRPKEAYYVYQSYWSAKPMVRVYGHTWPVRWGKAGEERMVRVYSNCGSAELFLNGKSVGVKTRDAQDFPCAGLRWKVAFAAGKNELRCVAKHAGGSVTDSVTFTYQTEVWGKPVKLVMRKLERMGPLTTVEAKLVDARGVVCLDARNVVRFSLAGAGRLVDNQGTPWGSRVVQLGNGRAEITVEMKSGGGAVAVSSEGVATGLVMIES